jgi:GDP-4-dehydro-6-deoxy-D-mannose reductase
MIGLSCISSVPKKKVLIFGGTGFVGKHLTSELQKEFQLTVSGQDVDVRDPAKVYEFIFKVKPDYVLNLAAVTSIPEAYADPVRTIDTNYIGVLNILNALKSTKFYGRFIFISSSEVYGKVPEASLPIKENLIPNPVNPYSISKFAAEELCRTWLNNDPLFEILIARPFNHIGPNQSTRFAIPGFAKQISDIKSGFCPSIIKVGDLEVSRDFTDVRDVASAYRSILIEGVNGATYNVCSGKALTIRSVLDKMVEISGLKIDIYLDSSKFRVNEQKIFLGSNEKLSRSTGWQPRIPIEVTLQDTIESFLGVLQKKN